MTRSPSTGTRCARCRMHIGLCICSLIPSPRIETRTRVVLVVHRIEASKSSNTGLLAMQCLANGHVIIRGDRDAPDPALDLPDGSVPLVLFPSADAVPIQSFVGAEKPITLVVPDGTWRQAAKMRHRVPGLRDVPCVAIPDVDGSNYRLRSATQKRRLATLEAIARALGILEGDPVRARMEFVLRAMVERTLWSRGQQPAHDVVGGIPHGAKRHDPRSGCGE